MQTPQTNPRKVVQILRQKTQNYYNGWCKAEAMVEYQKKLYKHSIELLVDNVKARKAAENRPPTEIIKKVPFEVIKEIYVEIPIEVPVEVIVEKEVRVPVEVIKEITVPVEVIKRVEVPFEVRVPFEVIKEIEVLREVPIEVKVVDEEALEEKDRVHGLATEALEKRYKVALIQEKVEHKHYIKEQGKKEKKFLKGYKWFATYAYLLTIFTITQLMWILSL